MSRAKIFINKINANKFFTPKKISLMVFGSILFLVAFILTFVFLKIDLGYIFKTIVDNVNKDPVYACFFILIIIIPLFRFFNVVVYLRPRLRRLGLEISRIEYFFLFLKITIINTITPFASGSEPYCIYWMKTRGANIEDANVISLVNTIMIGLTEIIITIPSFIYISVYYGTITQSAIGLTVYWFVFGGLCINFFITSSFFTIGQSKHIHIFISKCSNWVLKKLGKKHLSAEEIKQKYAVDNVFKKRFKEELKQFKLNIWIIVVNSINTCLLYLAVFLALTLLGVVDNNLINSNLVFNITNVAVTANNFIPIPGAEGTIQITIITLATIFPDLELHGSNIDFGVTQSIHLWRIFTNYIPLIFASILITLYYCYKLTIFHFRKIHNITGKVKYNTISYIVTIDELNKHHLERCLNSILATNHKKEIIISVKKSNTKASVEKILHKNAAYKNIKVVHLSSDNSLKTFRTLVHLINHKYFMFINAHDFIHPETSQRINEPMNSKTYDIVSFPQFIINEKGIKNQWKLNNWCKKDNKEYYLSNNYVSIYGMLFNKKFVIDHIKYFNNIDIYKNGISNLPYVIIKSDNFLYTNTFFYYHCYENVEVENKTSLSHYLEIFKGAVNFVANKKASKYIGNYLSIQESLIYQKIQSAHIDKEDKKQLYNELLKVKNSASFKYKTNTIFLLRYMYCKARGILP